MAENEDWDAQYVIEDDQHFDPLLDDVATLMEEDVDSESGVTKRVARRICTGSIPENEGTMDTQERPGTLSREAQSSGY